MGCFDNLRRREVAPERDASRWYDGPPADSVGWYWTPRVVSAGDYPLDLDASERVTRPRHGITIWPSPALQQTSDMGFDFMGYASGVMPQNNGLMVAIAAVKPDSAGPKLNDDMYSDSFVDIRLTDVLKMA